MRPISVFMKFIKILFEMNFKATKVLVQTVQCDNKKNEHINVNSQLLFFFTYYIVHMYVKSNKPFYCHCVLFSYHFIY